MKSNILFALLSALMLVAQSQAIEDESSANISFYRQAERAIRNFNQNDLAIALSAILKDTRDFTETHCFSIDIEPGDCINCTYSKDDILFRLLFWSVYYQNPEALEKLLSVVEKKLAQSNRRINCQSDYINLLGNTVRKSLMEPKACTKNGYAIVKALVNVGVQDQEKIDLYWQRKGSWNCQNKDLAEKIYRCARYQECP